MRLPVQHALYGALALAVGCPGNGEETATAQAGELQTLLVVVMDGVRLEESLGDEVSTATGELPRDMMPTIWDELAPQGYRSTNAWNVGATTTVPAHAALLAGRRLPYANFAMGSRPGLYRPRLPGLHEELENRGIVQSGRSLIVSNTPLLEGLAQSLWTWPDDAKVGGATFVMAVNDEAEGNGRETDRATLRRLRSRMDNGAVELALINLHKVDLVGHYGNSNSYPDAVRELDEPIVELWSWVQSNPRYADTTWMVLLADHGRNTTADTNPVWRHHGCQCNGCRRVPFLLLGPGVHAAASGDNPLLLTDVAPTLAALWGTSLPWADGLVRNDLLDSATNIASREGLADFAEAGGHRAELRYTDDPNHRKALWLDGVEVSNPEALEVESPALASSGDDAWLCFREVVLTPDERNTQWLARCLFSDDDGLSWDDIGAPAEPVGPWWHPTLLPRDGGLLALYPYNPNGLANTKSIDGQGAYWVEAAWWDGQGWSTAAAPEDVVFPTDLTAIPTDKGRVLVAVTGSTDPEDARNTRGIFTGTVTVEDGAPHWGQLRATRMTALNDDAASGWRLEQPALHVDPEGDPQLAAVAVGMNEIHGVVATTQGRVAWAAQGTVDLPGQPLPHLSPIWIDNRPAWAVKDGATGLVSVCAALPDEEPSCVETGSERVLLLRPGEGGIAAVVDRSEGQWELLEIDDAEFSAR